MRSDSEVVRCSVEGQPTLRARESRPSYRCCTGVAGSGTAVLDNRSSSLGHTASAGRSDHAAADSLRALRSWGTQSREMYRPTALGLPTKGSPQRRGSLTSGALFERV